LGSTLFCLLSRVMSSRPCPSCCMHRRTHQSQPAVPNSDGVCGGDQERPHSPDWRWRMRPRHLNIHTPSLSWSHPHTYTYTHTHTPTHPPSLSPSLALFAYNLACDLSPQDRSYLRSFFIFFGPSRTERRAECVEAVATPARSLQWVIFVNHRPFVIRHKGHSNNPIEARGGG
jgi:hypothetical protein